MKMKNGVGLLCQVCCGLALAMNASFAQSPFKPQTAQAPLTPSGAPAPALPAAPPVTVTPEMRAAIKDLFEITKFREGVRGAFDGFSKTLPQQMAQSIGMALQQNPQLSPEQKQQVGTSLNKSFEAPAREAIALLQDTRLVDQTVENAYPIYAKTFTLAEIKQLTAFYKTPLGTKMMTAMPSAAAEAVRSGMAIAQPRVAAIMNDLMKREIDAVQKK